MSSETIKGKVAYQCDLAGCHEGLETSYSGYAAAWAEASRTVAEVCAALGIGYRPRRARSHRIAI